MSAASRIATYPRLPACAVHKARGDPSLAARARPDDRIAPLRREIFVRSASLQGTYRMLQRAPNRDHIASKNCPPATLAAALCAGIAVCFMSTSASAQAPAPAKAPAKEAIPALASIKFAWLAVGADWRDPPPGSGHGPIKQDPAHPFHGNVDGPGQVTNRIANTDDPVLKPWAAAQMRASNQEAISGSDVGDFHGPRPLLSGRRSGPIAVSGGAVLFHPDPQGGVDDLAARPHGAPRLPHRQAFRRP